MYAVRLARLARLDAAALKRESTRAQSTLNEAEAEQREVIRLKRTAPQAVREGRILALDAQDLMRQYARRGLESDQRYDEAFEKRLAARQRARRFAEESALGTRLEELVRRAPSKRFASATDRNTVLAAVADMKAALTQRRKLNAQLSETYAKIASLTWETGVLASDLSDELGKSLEAAKTQALLYRAERTLSPRTLRRVWETVVGAGRRLPSWVGTLPEATATVLLGSSRIRSPGEIAVTYASITVLWVLALVAFKFIGERATVYERRLAEQEQRGTPHRSLFLLTHGWRLGRWLGLGGALYGTVQRLHFGPAAQAFFQVGFTGWIVAALVCKFGRVLLAPRREEFRVIPLADLTARRTLKLLRALGIVVVAGGSVLAALETSAAVPRDVTAVFRLLVWLTGIGLIAAMLHGPRGLLRALSPGSAGWESLAWTLAHFLARAFLVCAVAVVVVHAAGYWNLARYLARCIPLNGVALFVLWLLHRLLRGRAEQFIGRIQVAPRADAAQRARREVRAQLAGLVVWTVTGVGSVLLLCWVWDIRMRHLRRLLTTLQHPLLTVKGAALSPASVLKAVVLGAAVVWIANLVRRLIRSSFRLERRYTDGGRYALASLSFYGLLFLGFLWALIAAGFDLSVLTVFAGMAGIGLGFGLQDIVHNFISGLILLIERPIALNDFVQIGELQGTVTAISLRSTTVRTLDNVFVVVPNSQLVSGQVTNLSHRDTKIRLDIPVGVHYDSDMDIVYRVLREAAAGHPEVLKTPPPEVRMVEFGDNSVNFSILAWIEHPHRMPFVSAQIMHAVWETLQENGIEIPYPQQDLHVRTVSPEAAQTFLTPPERTAPRP